MLDEFGEDGEWDADPAGSNEDDVRAGRTASGAAWRHGVPPRDMIGGGSVPVVPYEGGQMEQLW
ncbi:hypothetical protein GCM10014715_74660 [Streptomyces spiralis]|uniref:Uncharacterized protein n=1 Tax=Streptomyces spiralis TaxID=66376 RepID=A0A919AGY8_9ACTN|nr:hypothetical protein GCM10014715_74660 [Streptomyces spiralis]